MKLKKKRLLSFYKELFLNSIKMLFSNKVRTILVFSGILICVTLLTVTSLVMRSTHQNIMYEFVRWPQNVVALDGGILDNEIDNCINGQKNLFASKFYFSTNHNFNKQVTVQEIGVGENYLKTIIPESDKQGVFTSEIICGRNFNSNEIKGYESAAMLTKSSSLLLFGTENCVSEVLKLSENGVEKEYKIVAVINDSYYSASKFENFRNSNSKDERISLALYTPFANTSYSQFGVFNYSILYTNPDTSILDLHKFNTLDNYFINSSYRMDSFVNYEEAYNSTLDSFNNTYIPFFVILIVGEIITLSIFFFFSVKERVTEIGIRKALGAQNSHIVMQFIMENFILSLIVSLVGCILGTLAYIIYLLNINIGKVFIFSGISIFPVLMVFLLSVMIMILLSIIPGLIAQKIKIIDALRFD